MNLGALFITSFIMGFSGAMMPGPLLTVNIHESLRRGFLAGLLLILGHAILEIALVIGLIMGLQEVLEKPFFQGSVAVAGGLVLLWMGWGMCRDAWLGRITLAYETKQEYRGMPPVLAGILVSVSNPYWIIWWAAIGLNYVTQSLQRGLVGLAVFMTGHLLADFTWYGAVSFAVVSGRKLLSEKIYRGIILVCGLFLCGLALYFITSAETLFSG